MAGAYEGYKNFNRMGAGPRTPAYYHKSKLTPAQRQEISHLLMEGERPTDLALRFGVSRTTIGSIHPSERP